MTGVLERAAATADHGRRSWMLRRGLPVVVLVALVGWLVAFSPVLAVRTVKITGLRVATDEQVSAVASVQMGVPLARVDTAAMARRVEKLAAVKTAKVSVSYPSTLLIAVVERTAVGVVGAPGQQTLVDAADIAFQKVTAAPAELPALARYADARDAMLAAVAGQLPASLLKLVATIDAQTPESVSLHLRDRRTFVWGGIDRAGEKAQLMTALLGQPGTYFDLSDPDTVISRGAPAPAPSR